MSCDPTADAAAAALALGIRPGHRVWLGGRNVAVRRIVSRWLEGTQRPPTGTIDLAFICPESTDEAAYFGAKLWSRVSPTGIVRVVVDCESKEKAVAYMTDVHSQLEGAGWEGGELEAIIGLWLFSIKRT